MTTQRDRLREARIAKRLTQEDLAHVAGISTVTVARLETERTEPTLRVAIALSQALDSSVEWLFAVPPDKTAPHPRGDQRPRRKRRKIPTKSAPAAVDAAPGLDRSGEPHEQQARH